LKLYFVAWTKLSHVKTGDAAYGIRKRQVRQFFFLKTPIFVSIGFIHTRVTGQNPAASAVWRAEVSSLSVSNGWFDERFFHQPVRARAGHR
jgi:hypothetical protein